MSHEATLKETQKEWHGSFRHYLIGFFSSFLLTIISFSLVISRAVSDQNLIYLLIALALTQAIFQLIFFLHMLQEQKPRWGILVFCFMVTILLVISIGSLWIMYDLNERMMPEMSEMR